MNKAANISWDSPDIRSRAARPVRPAKIRRRPAAAVKRRTAPWWLSCLIVSSIFVMLCVSINFRAFSEMRDEMDQHERLSSHIQNLMDENLALQEEIHVLKTDPNAIGREARRIGVDVKVPVPTN